MVRAEAVWERFSPVFAPADLFQEMQILGCRWESALHNAGGGVIWSEMAFEFIE